MLITNGFMHGTVSPFAKAHPRPPRENLTHTPHAVIRIRAGGVAKTRSQACPLTYFAVRASHNGCITE